MAEHEDVLDDGAAARPVQARVHEEVGAVLDVEGGRAQLSRLHGLLGALLGAPEEGRLVGVEEGDEQLVRDLVRVRVRVRGSGL